jgi:hypothetical protein
MDIVTKEATAQVMPVANSEHPNGEFDLILSTDDLDRDGENLYPEDWAKLPDHIHFDTDHAFRDNLGVEKTAGSGVPSIESGQLRVRGTYAGTAHGQTTRQLVNDGHIRTASVAYTQRKDGTRELLNGSFVAVPANPYAKILSSKGVKAVSDDDTPGPEDDENEDDMPSHDDLVQAAHDAMVHLGAECQAADDGESDGANKSYNLLTRLLGEAVLKAAKTKDPKKPFGVDTEKSSDSKSVGSSQSADESAAAVTTKMVTAAADESADDATQQRARAFLLKMSTARALDY